MPQIDFEPEVAAPKIDFEPIKIDFEPVGKPSPTPETDKALAQLPLELSTPPPESVYDPNKYPIAERAAQAAVDVAKGFIPRSVGQAAGMVTPIVGAAHDIRQTAGAIKDWVSGKSLAEIQAERFPETKLLAEADKTPPFSKERFEAGFQILTNMGMIAAGGRALARPEAPVARPEGETAPTTPRGVEPAPAATTEATGAVPEQPLTQSGGEQYAQQPSDAQVQAGDVTLGVEARPEGEVPDASSGDNVIRETSGEKPIVGEPPPQEDVAVTQPGGGKVSASPETLTPQGQAVPSSQATSNLLSDESGKPIVMYHGTSRVGAKEFGGMPVVKMDEHGRLVPTGDTHTVWWTSDKTAAEAYGGGNVVAAYLEIKNPSDQLTHFVSQLGDKDGAIARHDDGTITAVIKDSSQIKPVVEGAPPKEDVAVTQPEGGDEPATAAVSGAETPPAAEPRLLPGEQQGDLISSTQAEPFRLVGEQGTDYGSKQIQAEAEAQRAEEARLKAEHEQELLGGFQEYQKQGGDEFYDALEESGGLPALSSTRKQFSGELQQIREEYKSPTRKDVIRYSKIFKSNAPDLDVVAQRMREKGFNIETPDDLLNMARERLRTGRPIYGEEVKGAVYGFGPGAAAKGETLTPITQIRQLSDIARSISSDRTKPVEQAVAQVEKAIPTAKRPNLIVRARDTVQASWRVLHDRYLAPPIEGDFKSAIKDWQGADQKSSFYVRQFTKEVNRAFPNKLTQEALTNWIQANGDMRVLADRASQSKPEFKQGYEAAMRLTPEQEAFARNTQQYLEAMLSDGRNAGILEHGVDNYITQIWKRPNRFTKELQAAVQSGKLDTNFKYARKRIFGSYFDGEQAGYIPASKQLSHLISAYDLSFNRAISARAFVKSLREARAADGEPIIKFSGMSSKVPNGAEVPEAYLIRQKAHPMAAETADGRRYVPIDHPALRGWKWALETDRGQPVYMQSDMLVHPDYINQLKNVLGSSVFRHNPITRAMLTGGSFLKQSKLSLSLFHLDQEGLHGLFHRVNPANLERIDFENPKQWELVRNGLQVADFRAQELFSEGLSGGGIVERIPGLGRLHSLYTEFLFKDYIPRLKMTMALHAFERNLKRYPKLAREQIAEITANQSNAAFGELNYKLLGRNPTMQDFLRLTILAPDFLEARTRFVGQALKPYGREQQVALMLMGTSLYAGGRILNQALDNNPHWDTPFSVFYGGREYRLRTVLGDLQEAVTDPGRFFYNRFSPWLRGVTEFTTGRDYRGIKRNHIQQAEDFLSWLLPIPTTPSSTEGLAQRTLQSAGVSSRPGPEMRKQMRKDAAKRAGEKRRGRRFSAFGGGALR